MSDDQQSTGVPHWPRIRITRLWDLLSQAKSWNDLCAWFISNAFSARYQLYWKVPRGYVVRLGSRRIDGGYGEHVNPDEPPLPPEGSQLPTIEFVRLAPLTAQQVAEQARQTGTMMKDPIPAHRFPGGLFGLDIADVPSGSREALPFSVELHIQSLSPSAINAWETMDVNPTNVYVDDAVYGDIRSHLKNELNVQSDAQPTMVDKTAEQPGTPGTAPAVPSWITSTPIAQELTCTSDPYNLKDRAPAVFALYQAAELCSQNPEYSLASVPKSERKGIANKALLRLAEASRGLKHVFEGTRRDYATQLIDPERDPNAGRSKKKPREWPTKTASKVFSQDHDRRPSFVSDTLLLIIHAAEQWLRWKESPPAGIDSKLCALNDLLTELGLTGSSERKTLFPIITFDGAKFQKAPESPAPSTSHGRATGARHASRPRSA